MRGCSCGLVALLVALLLPGGVANASITYYNNVPIGARSAGFGGAYTALSDDASALHFNPAGLAFSEGDSIQGSANTYSIRRTTYLRTIGENSFREASSGLFPSFFGGVRRTRFLPKDLVGGFALYSSEFEARDQDDVIEAPQQAISAYHRILNKNASTLHAVGGLGWRVTEQLGLGVALGPTLSDDLLHLSQNSSVTVDVASLGLEFTPAAAADGPVTSYQQQSLRSRMLLTGLDLAAGVLWRPTPAWQIGASLKRNVVLHQSFLFRGDQSSGYYLKKSFRIVQRSDLQLSQAPHADSERRLEEVASGVVRRQSPSDADSMGGPFVGSLDEPVLKGPLAARLGIAWIPAWWFQAAADVAYHFKAPGYASIETERVAIWNAALGMEWRLTRWLPVRLGGFTNRDARPRLAEGVANQTEHLDLYGATFQAGVLVEDREIALAASFQRGKGKAQKLMSNDALQNVVGEALSLVLSSHQRL